jgi:hypothetical protein
VVDVAASCRDYAAIPANHSCQQQQQASATTETQNRLTHKKEGAVCSRWARALGVSITDTFTVLRGEERGSSGFIGGMGAPLMLSVTAAGGLGKAYVLRAWAGEAVGTWQQGETRYERSE